MQRASFADIGESLWQKIIYFYEFADIYDSVAYP